LTRRKDGKKRNGQLRKAGKDQRTFDSQVGTKIKRVHKSELDWVGGRSSTILCQRD